MKTINQQTNKQQHHHHHHYHVCRMHTTNQPMGVEVVGISDDAGLHLLSEQVVLARGLASAQHPHKLGQKDVQLLSTQRKRTRQETQRIPAVERCLPLRPSCCWE